MQPTSPHTTLRKIAVILLLILLAFAWAPRTAFAQAIIRGDTIPAGEVVDNDVILSGDVVHLSGTVRGNAFVAGRDVIVDGHVEGSLFVIGQRITIDGAVDGGAYSLGLVALLDSCLLYTSIRILCYNKKSPQKRIQPRPGGGTGAVCILGDFI